MMIMVIIIIIIYRQHPAVLRIKVGLTGGFSRNSGAAMVCPVPTA